VPHVVTVVVLKFSWTNWSSNWGDWASGMSTFSTAGGLYEKAQKRFGVIDGKRLFAWNFYEKRKLDVLSFYADIYAEALKAVPGQGHYALRRLERRGKLLRHYTMNIDGLAEAAGLTIWHHEHTPEGRIGSRNGCVQASAWHLVRFCLLA
jgi:Sir2 family